MKPYLAFTGALNEPSHHIALLVTLYSSTADSIFQVWELATCRIQTDHVGHTGYINTVTISPDGSLCETGR